MTKTTKITLPARQGDYAIYETAAGAFRFHIERTSQPSLFGVENVTEGFTLVPRTRPEIAKLIAKHKLIFAGIGREG